MAYKPELPAGVSTRPASASMRTTRGTRSCTAWPSARNGRRPLSARLLAIEARRVTAEHERARAAAPAPRQRPPGVNLGRSCRRKSRCTTR